MGSRAILLIEDEEDIREVVQISLEMHEGWRVSTARSGREGLEKARTEQFDAILLDVMMPNMDGPTTFRQLQADADTRQIPVILLTAKVQANDRRAYAELGVAGVIGKPFNVTTLASQIGQVLGLDS